MTINSATWHITITAKVKDGYVLVYSTDKQIKK